MLRLGRALMIRDDDLIALWIFSLAGLNATFWILNSKPVLFQDLDKVLALAM